MPDVWNITRSRQRLEQCLDTLDRKRDQVCAWLQVVQAIERDPSLLKRSVIRKQLKAAFPMRRPSHERQTR
jgi:hypothetical protein